MNATETDCIVNVDNIYKNFGALQVLKGVGGIAQCYFTEKDVVRHRLVQEIIKAYEAAAHPAKR